MWTTAQWGWIRFGLIGDDGFVDRHRRGRLLEKEDIAQVAQLVTAGSVPQAVIAQLVKAGRQDMLEKASDELMAG